jgi:curved DNA-binding protein CbpA
MDHYEQLGVTRHASVDEIRRAYRRLSKLVHPDQYANAASKQIAEGLMSRINAISDTLLDPDRRYLYDQQCSEQPEAKVPSSLGQHRFRWWAIGAFAAIALILSAVWFWANSVGSSFGKPASVDSSFGKNSGSATAEPPAAVPSSLEDARLAARSNTTGISAKRSPQREKGSEP